MPSRRAGAPLITTAYGLRSSRAKATVSLTASRSNTPGRQGTTTSVAARIASVTLADMLGAVSMKTLGAVALGGLDDVADTALGRLQRQFGVVAQLVPERQRAL